MPSTYGLGGLFGGSPQSWQPGQWLSNQGYAGPMPGTPEFQAARQAGQHPIMDWYRTQHPNWQAPGMGGFMPPQMPSFDYQGGMPAWGGGGQNQGIAVGEYNPSAPSSYGPRAGMGSNASQGKPMQPQGLSGMFTLPTKKQQNPGFY